MAKHAPESSGNVRHAQNKSQKQPSKAKHAGSSAAENKKLAKHLRTRKNRTHKSATPAVQQAAVEVSADLSGASSKRNSHRKFKATKMDWSVLTAVVLVCMFTLGYLLFSSSLLIQNKNSHKSVRSANEYEEAVSKLKPEDIDKIQKDIINFDNQVSSRSAPDPFSSGAGEGAEQQSTADKYTDILGKVSSDMLGYLTVPKADFSGPIYYGDVNQTLNKGVGYLSYTAIPSQVKGTRTVLYGHTGLDNLHVFDDLDKLRTGDSVYVRVLKTTYHYKIVDSTVVRPSQIDVIRPQKGKTLVTLLTCTPKGVNDHRLLVSGELVSVDEDKPELKLTQDPFLLAVTLIPLAVCAIGTAYVWMRRQQINSLTKNSPKSGKIKGQHE
ncbi:class C sortase [Bombiscardovia coagulans]|uniref:class C sortase n=1 Tax=Bombiscardovia coagulans TaxID=686666 RepID=UPI001314CF15|nr:class C sortase [Bombiscardovia coagulans]